MVRLRSEEGTHLRLVADRIGGSDSADEMKHFVMGMIAVATVLCVVIGSVLLSDVLRIVAVVIRDSFALPTLAAFN